MREIEIGRGHPTVNKMETKKQAAFEALSTLRRLGCIV